MPELLAGFGLIEISPLAGTPLAGHFQPRYASGVNDPLFARVLALTEGETSVVLVSCDLIALAGDEARMVREAVAKTLPVPEGHVIILSTHTHTGPATKPSFATPMAEDYLGGLPALVSSAAEMAWYDRAPACATFVRRSVTGVGFERRYRMKDGTIRTNPGVGNPDVIEPYRQVRTALSLLAFERDATRLPIVLAAFPCHADVVGGDEVSADFPGRTCDHLTHRLPGHPETLFARGPAGDINHIDVDGGPSQKGYELAKQMASRLADAAVAMWDERTDVTGALGLRAATVSLPRRPVSEDAIKDARLTITRAEVMRDEERNALWARELFALAEMPEEVVVEVALVTIGRFALLALPGELFSELAERIEDGSPFGQMILADCSGGGAGYILPQASYAQDGYEERPARSSPYAPGAGELLVAAAMRLLER